MTLCSCLLNQSKKKGIILSDTDVFTGSGELLYSNSKVFTFPFLGCALSGRGGSGALERLASLIWAKAFASFDDLADQFHELAEKAFWDHFQGVMDYHGFDFETPEQYLESDYKDIGYGFARCELHLVGWSAKRQKILHVGAVSSNNFEQDFTDDDSLLGAGGKWTQGFINSLGRLPSTENERELKTLFGLQCLAATEHMKEDGEYKGNMVGGGDVIKTEVLADRTIKHTILGHMSDCIALVKEWLDGPKHQPKTSSKVGRNDPCPCGSGKKHKKCCGK